MCRQLRIGLIGSCESLRRKFCAESAAIFSQPVVGMQKVQARCEPGDPQTGLTHVHSCFNPCPHSGLRTRFWCGAALLQCDMPKQWQLPTLASTCWTDDKKTFLDHAPLANAAVPPWKALPSLTCWPYRATASHASHTQSLRRPGLAESSRRPNREALKTPNRAESRGADKYTESPKSGIESFFENGKFYVLCKVVNDCKLAPGTRKVELFVLSYRNGF